MPSAPETDIQVSENFEHQIIIIVFCHRILLIFLRRFYMLLDRVSHMQDIKNDSYLKLLRAVMMFPIAKIVRRNAIFLAFSRSISVNANITLRNANRFATKRRAKSCTNIFFPQKLRHSESPQSLKNSVRFPYEHLAPGIAYLCQIRLHPDF